MAKLYYRVKKLKSNPKYMYTYDPLKLYVDTTTGEESNPLAGDEEEDIQAAIALSLGQVVQAGNLVCR